MRIQSKFKDYYDYVAFQYGGGDPRVTYDRKPLNENLIKSFKPQESPGLISNLIYESPECVFAVTPILFCGRVFYITQSKADYENQKENWEILSPDFLERQRNGAYKIEIKGDFYRRVDVKQVNWRYRGFSGGWARAANEQLIPLSEQSILPSILELHRFFGAPILLWEGQGLKGKPRKEIPILSNFGFAKYFPAEQVYQELAMFVGNTLNENPDSTPPAKVSNKHRILQHGFDLKQSFRH